MHRLTGFDLYPTMQIHAQACVAANKYTVPRRTYRISKLNSFPGADFDSVCIISSLSRMRFRPETFTFICDVFKQCLSLQ